MYPEVPEPIPHMDQLTRIKNMEVATTGVWCDFRTNALLDI